MKSFRKRVTLSDAWVNYNDKLSDFYASSWQRGDSPVPMLVVRLMLAALAVSILVWSVVDGTSKYWPIYLTNWGLVFITAMSLSGLLVSIIASCKNFPDSTDIPWYFSMYWFFFNISITIAFTITCLYWILLFDAEAAAQNAPRLLWLDVSTHALNSGIALVELLASRTPVRLLHFYQPFGVALWYAAFSAIYYAAGGTDGLGNPYIYPVLDWRNGEQSGILISIAAAGVIVLYVAVWITGLCRDKLSSALIRTISQDLAYTPEDIDHTRIV